MRSILPFPYITVMVSDYNDIEVRQRAMRVIFIDIKYSFCQLQTFFRLSLLAQPLRLNDNSYRKFRSAMFSALSMKRKPREKGKLLIM